MLTCGSVGPTGPTTGQPNIFSGSINRYDSAGAFDQVLVDSSRFPNTGTMPNPSPPPATLTIQGIVPSQLVYYPAPTL